jgi:hypothetical protein
MRVRGEVGDAERETAKAISDPWRANVREWFQERVRARQQRDAAVGLTAPR